MAENNNKQENIILCANSCSRNITSTRNSNYSRKTSKELQIMCVLFTEDVGGILFLEFTPEGNLEFPRDEAEDQKLSLREMRQQIRQYQREKKEL